MNDASPPEDVHEKPIVFPGRTLESGVRRSEEVYTPKETRAGGETITASSSRDPLPEEKRNAAGCVTSDDPNAFSDASFAVVTVNV